MTWESPIWLYLWLAGMAGGAYFTAFLVDRFSGGQQKALLRLATYVALPLAILGVLLLVLDLGVPERFWRLFATFDIVSAMSMGTWILVVFSLAASGMIFLWWFGERFLARDTVTGMTNALSWIAMVFSALLIAYTGVLLASSNQPLWAATFLIPSLFVASAISTGVAIIIITALVTRSRPVTNGMLMRLAEADAIVIGIEMVLMVAFALWLAVSGMEGAGEGLEILIRGSLAPAFWVGVVLLAILIPLGLELFNRGKELRKRANWYALATSAGAVIIGGLILRAVIVYGGQESSPFLWAVIMYGG